MPAETSGIVIATSYVTLDLNGFSITGPGEAVARVFALNFRHCSRIVPQHPRRRVDNDKPLAPMIPDQVRDRTGRNASSACSHRYRVLSKVRRHSARHRMHRGASSDSENPGSMNRSDSAAAGAPEHVILLPLLLSEFAG